MNKKPQERRRGHDTERNGERASERVLIVHRETREIPEIREGCSNRCGKAPKERRKCCLVPERGGTGWGVALPGDAGLSSHNTKNTAGRAMGIAGCGE
ncbi:hypothetical protein QQF64_007302 [Cirrhinus molitorella]|uniref:Uncharacterized protein n=1 Tax=Cirrhinus molitorella TaxID=172907 RepID=A0ABR3MA95_9TELE